MPFLLLQGLRIHYQPCWDACVRVRVCVTSVQFSRSGVSSLSITKAQTHVRWVSDAIPTISSSVVPFSSCPQSFPASRSFQMSQLLASGSQSIGVSASTSVLPMNTQDWSPLGWTSWISLQSKGVSRVFSNTTVQSINSLVLSFLYSPVLTSVHDYWKNHSFD